MMLRKKTGYRMYSMNMKVWMKEKQNIFFLLLLVLCMGAAFYFCVQKAGFHEDEYYTLYSTARSEGFFVEDGKWMSREELAGEYTVLPGEGFSYGLVKQVQSWDVHPPLYYFAVHTMESLFPATLSKWHGLSVNLMAYFGCLVLLFVLAKTVLRKIADRQSEFSGNESCDRDSQKGKIAGYSAFVMLLYGLSPAGLSSVTLIRMYALLTVFVLWAAILHVKNMDEDKLTGKSFWLPLAVCTFLGFMTQYYYFLFLFFMAAAFCCYRLITKGKFSEVVQYGLVMAGTFGVAYLFYPAYPSHMFSGQRGGQAANNFFDMGILWERLRYFGGLLQKFLFADCFWFLAVLLVVLSVLAKTGHRGTSKTEAENNGKHSRTCSFQMLSGWVKLYGTLLVIGVSCLGYFLVASKTSLLVGDAAIRYMVPICPLLVLETVGILILAGWKMPSMKQVIIGILVAWLALNLVAAGDGRVLFLYPRDAEKIARAQAYQEQGIPVAYAYDPYQTWCIWDSSNELLVYDEVYFLEENKGDMTLEERIRMLDERIRGADQLVLYVSTVGDAEACLADMLSACPYLSECRLLQEDTYCRMYLLQ